MTAEPSLIAARALLYGGALPAFGLPAYFLYAPVSAREWLESRRWPWRCVIVAATLGVAATLLHLALLAAAMNGVTPGALDRAMVGFVATGMPVGRAALIRGAALGLIIPGALLLRGRARASLCAAAGGIAVGSLAWNGHAMMHDGWEGRAHLIADQIHLLAAAMWIGALAALLGLGLAAGGAAGPRRKAFAAFSFAGTLLVAALALSGIVNGGMILLLSDSQAPAPDYLALLAVKILLFLGALALAANNRFRLAPALSGERSDVAERALRRSVAIEFTFIAIILLVVSAMGVLQPTT